MHNPLRPLRVAILCSFNLDLMTRPLEGLLKQHLFQPHLYLSAYGQWEIDPLNSDSDLYQFAPDIVLLFAEFSDLMPTANRDGMLPLAEEAQALGQDAWSRVEAVLHSLLQFLPSHTQILCHNLLAPQVSSLGLLEGNAGYSLVCLDSTMQA
jgi:hypothetical protein